MKASKIKVVAIALIAFLAISIVLVPNNFAHAQSVLGGLLGIGSVTAGAIGYFAYGVIYFLSLIAGFFIAVITYLIGVILYLSNNIVNTTAVQSGYAVTLAVANLGFVLAIIIIAMATILNRQTYNIKKTLWKLVIAAILVNFSLVIGGAFINFANVLTNSFFQQLGGIKDGPGAFAKLIAGAFEPQRFLLFSGNTPGGGGSVLNPPVQGANAGSTLASIFTPLVGVASAALFLFAITVTLATLLIQLIVRYVILALLLVLAPFAWLLWLFPQTSKQFSSWWRMFFRWCFFAPIVVFFLWLAIATAQTMSTPTGNCTPSPNHFCGDLAYLNGTQYVSSNNNVIGGLSSTLGSFVGGFAGSALQAVVIIGLAIGGMIVANKFGITMADSAVNATQSAGRWMGNKAGQIGQKGARAGWQKVGGEKISQRMREGRLGKFEKIPVLGGAMKRGASVAGRAIEGISTNEAMVKEAQKKVPKNWEEAKRNLQGSMNTEDQLAHIALGVKEGRIKATDTVNGKSVADFLDANRDVLRRYGQGKLLGDANKVFMSDTNYRNAQRAIAAEDKKNFSEAYENAKKEGKTEGEAKKIAEGIRTNLHKENIQVKVVEDVEDETGKVVIKKGDTVLADELMNASGRQMMQKFTPEDASKVDVNTLFGPKAVMDNLKEVETRMRNIALYAPKIVPNLVKGMRSPALNQFIDRYDEKLTSLLKEHRDKLTKAVDEDEKKNLQRTIAHLEKVQESYRKGVVKNLYGTESFVRGGKEEAEEHEEKKS